MISIAVLRVLFLCMILINRSFESVTEKCSFKRFEDVLRHFKSLHQLSSHVEVASLMKSLDGSLKSAIPKNLFVNNSEVINGSQLSDGGDCRADLLYILTHMNRKWAVEMIDADGKLQSGVLRGNYLWMGNFRECIEVNVKSQSNKSSHVFRGRYCVAQWNINISSESVSLPLKTAICIPDSCNGTVIKSDIQAVLHYIAHIPLIDEYSSLLSLEAFTCENPHEKLDKLAISFLIFVGFVSMLILCGSSITAWEYFFTRKSYQPIIYNFIHSCPSETSSVEHEPMPDNSPYDSYRDEDVKIFLGSRNHSESKFHDVLSQWKPQSKVVFTKMKQFLQYFCIFANGQKILTTKITQEHLLCIHGVRVISMVWIILGHTYAHCIYFVGNAVDAMEDIDNVPFQVVIQGTFSVDSFFLLSGFLLVYLFLKEADKKQGQICWPYLFVHRYWRLTPVYAVIIFYVTAIFKYTNSGAFWDDTDNYGSCRKYWWWNLLYINNFLNIDCMCIAWSWYLANDMQFFIITTCLLFVIWRYPKIGLSVVTGLLLTSWVMTGMISHNNSIHPLFSDFENAKNYTEYTNKIYHSWDLTYSKPYCRIGPYLIGVFLAYAYYKTGQRKRFFSWWQQLLGWVLASFCSLSVIYGLYHMKTENQVLFDFYNALSRSSFSLGVAWVIYNCLTGHSVIVNKILSYKLWIPLSRLTYCAYLIHPVIMSWYFQGLDQPLYFTHQTMVLYFFAFLLMSYGIAFILSVAFESPLMNLEKSVRKKISPD